MPQEEGVSRMVSRPGIPFFSGTFLGVVYSGASDERMLLDSVRVTAPLGRLAVLDPTPGTRPSMESQGLQILMEEESVLVAKRGGGATAPAFVTLRGP
jgi:hypothetical protein